MLTCWLLLAAFAQAAQETPSVYRTETRPLPACGLPANVVQLAAVPGPEPRAIDLDVRIYITDSLL